MHAKMPSFAGLDLQLFPPACWMAARAGPLESPAGLAVPGPRPARDSQIADCFNSRNSPAALLKQSLTRPATRRPARGQIAVEEN